MCARTTDRRRGIPFSPRGSGGPVPPLRRYYETLRLPPVLLAALRCLRLAIPPIASDLCSQRPPTRGRGHRGVGVPVSRAGMFDGDERVSQVPRDPSCALALLSDPGGTEHVRPLRRVGAVPAADKSEDSRNDLSRLNHTAWTLAVYASPRGSPLPTQDSLPAAGQALPGGIRITRRVPSKGFRVSSLFLLS